MYAYLSGGSKNPITTLNSCSCQAFKKLDFVNLEVMLCDENDSRKIKHTAILRHWTTDWVLDLTSHCLFQMSKLWNLEHFIKLKLWSKFEIRLTYLWATLR